MKQRLDVLQHKVIDMVKQIEDQSDIIDKFQSTVSAYSNLHAWSHCANQAHRIFDAKNWMNNSFFIRDTNVGCDMLLGGCI
jgi:hypothetical protein